MNVYSSRIKEYMELSDLTMEDVAKRSGLPLSGIESIILEDRIPKISELLAIAEINDISMDYFLGRIKYPLFVSRTKIEAEFYCTIEQLPKEDLSELLKRVEARRELKE